MVWFKENVSNKKKWLSKKIKKPIANITKLCGYEWQTSPRVTELLAQEFHNIPYCQKLYAMNTDYIQIGASITTNNVDINADGFKHANKPYCTGSLPFRGLLLTSAYTGENAMPLITVIQAINLKDKLLGFIAADFDLRDLPVSNISTSQHHWQQFKGDPSIRSTVFMQERSQSELDKNMEIVMDNMFNLFCDHGVFHSVIHFSSSLCTLWSDDDPYSYRIHDINEMTTPELFLLYPRRQYSKKAVVAPDKIPLILSAFKTLRNVDNTFYLRSASLNIMNNMISLTFSCDGSHYMMVDEFLEKEPKFWSETPAQAKTG